ncbi:MAG: NAD(P)-dependent oxidoreductase [Actinomycetota bacterium]
MIRILNAESAGYDPAARDVLASVGTVIDADLDRAGLLAALGEVDVLIVRLRTEIDHAVLDAAGARLRLIVTATTGLDHIDVEAAAARDVTVLSLRGETEFLRTIAATAEHTWALLLALVRRLPAAAAAAAAGATVIDRDRFRGGELAGSTLGIVGLGRIGSIVASYGLAFGMRVLAHDPNVSTAPDGVGMADDLLDLCRRADVVSVHVPLDETTTGLIDRAALEALGPGGRVVNTSRGAVIDEEALCDLLESGRLAGAALDVVTDERSSSRRLLDLAAAKDNVLITPHIGGATHESMARTERFMAEKLRRWITENPQER